MPRSPKLTSSGTKRVQLVERRVMQSRITGPLQRGFGDMVHATVYLDGHAFHRPIGPDRPGLDDV